MPTFLWFYLAGMGLSVAIGLVFYYVIGGRITPLLSSLFGPLAGSLWGRSFRLLLVAGAVMGGLSVQWYGCSYSDYSAVAQDTELMFKKTTQQVAGAMDYATWILVVAAALATLVFAIQRAGRGEVREDGDK